MRAGGGFEETETSESIAWCAGPHLKLSAPFGTFPEAVPILPVAGAGTLQAPFEFAINFTTEWS